MTGHLNATITAANARNSMVGVYLDKTKAFEEVSHGEAIKKYQIPWDHQPYALMTHIFYPEIEWCR